jgi:hypothetical protein
MALASRGKSKEWEPYSETVIYIRNKYGQLKGTPHYYRMATVILFLERHMKGLKKMGIVKICASTPLLQKQARPLCQNCARIRCFHAIGVSFERKADSPNY